MKKFRCRQMLIRMSLAIVPLTLLNVTFAGKCCREITGCSGCLQVSYDPPIHISLGRNIIDKCVSTSLPMTCDENSLVCFSGTNVNVYDAGCSNIIGTTAISYSLPQCDASDDICNVGE
jgi:hypothetical protein